MVITLYPLRVEIRNPRSAADRLLTVQKQGSMMMHLVKNTFTPFIKNQMSYINQSYKIDCYWPY